MHISDIILLAIGLAMDCFAVSIACGMVMKKIKIWPTLRIAFFFGFFQAMMPIFGWLVGSRFQTDIEKYDHWIAFIILTFLGGRMIHEQFKHKHPEKKRLNPYKLKVIITLAVATSIDALAVGFTFAFLKMNLWLSILIIGLASLLFSIIGILLGHHYLNRLNFPAELLGGLVLIGIGAKILIEHLYF
jgi:manganese efflux pump family protein